MPSRAEPPLFVDLDGTLIDGDTLVISVGLLARRRPWSLPLLPLALLRGRSELKRFIALQVIPDPMSLPWRTEVLEFVRAQRQAGRAIYLATAADSVVAEAVARHLGIFDGIVASSPGANLKSAAKLAAIRKMLGHNEFDYIGDSDADLPIFEAAREVYLVAPSARFESRVRRMSKVRRVFPRR